MEILIGFWGVIGLFWGGVIAGALAMGIIASARDPVIVTKEKGGGA